MNLSPNLIRDGGLVSSRRGGRKITFYSLPNHFKRVLSKYLLPNNLKKGLSKYIPEVCRN